MSLRIRDRMILLAFGVVVVMLAFAPRGRSEVHVAGKAICDHVLANPDDMPIKKCYEFGWKNSPLVVYHYERKLTEENGKILKHETRDTQIHWASWSLLTLVAGLAILSAALLPPSKPQSRAP